MTETQRLASQVHHGRAYYAATLTDFHVHTDDHILATLITGGSFAIEPTQRDAWINQIACMRQALAHEAEPGLIAFEYVVPRVGRRIDVLLVLRNIIFVIEFKVGAETFEAHATEQVWDYALDLKNFHSTSHDKTIVPILIATNARVTHREMMFAPDHDEVFRPIHVAPHQLADVIAKILTQYSGAAIDSFRWSQGRYTPTPTIIEAAKALYGRHGVEEISRSDASAINLTHTNEAISQIIQSARDERRKSLCMITGVPGAGKTLVGLNVATQHMDPGSDLYSVFLSGNDPLVAILREALARDKAGRMRMVGERIPLSRLRSEVKAFIQNVHHFRDECLRDDQRPPIEHVALFDEAQRAWRKDRTVAFMARKKKIANFAMSEPEFLISCMDRHRDWAVIICLVGGGQEINTGEAGIGEWIRAIRSSFPNWHVHLSPHLHDSEYEAGQSLTLLEGHTGVHVDERLHLAVSMRSFRAEKVSALVKAILDLDTIRASSLLADVVPRYPIVLTRDINRAKTWLRARARGSEQYGMVVSSQAQRLKPHAIDVRSPVDPVQWFLYPREDVRSSYFLEDVGTEFHVQGLELDWTGVVWDGDFRFHPSGWDHWSFKGDKWQRIRALERQMYQKNAYRVLLTRARQGMVIVVPEGNSQDHTRSAAYYDTTYDYLRGLGMPELGSISVAPANEMTAFPTSRDS